MDRDIRILNSNKRDATRIVTRKPSNGEGENGDIAVGGTAKGPMLFVKAKNIWKSLKPRSVPPVEDSTFEGNILCSTVSWNITDAGASSTWIPLGAGDYIGGQKYEVAAQTDGSENSELAMLAPHDITIKNFSIRTNSNLPTGTTIFRLYVLKDRATNWDTNSAGSAVTTNDTSSSYAMQASVDITELNTSYNVPFDNTYIIKKNSLSMIHAYNCDNGVFIGELHFGIHG